MFLLRITLISCREAKKIEPEIIEDEEVVENLEPDFPIS
jgi:hypothetical protein